jgi:hypothetical protein
LAGGFRPTRREALNRNRKDFEKSANRPLDRPLLIEKRFVGRQPKILSKVITRFESKLGAGRPVLRWTTQTSQVQLREVEGNGYGGTLLTLCGF